VVDERISEVDYGSWTGRKIGDLVKEPLWAVVQQQPSAAVFPGGEGLAHVQARAVAAVREHDRRLAEQRDGDALWVACTHGDVIKAVVADALGTHLDSFQRITADPASMSVIRYTALRPFVIHVNHTGDQLTAGLLAKPPKADAKAEDKDGEVPPEDAVVGGSTD
jgi:probable phosphomutase (TIGR03848 family)